VVTRNREAQPSLDDVEQLVDASNAEVRPLEVLAVVAVGVSGGSEFSPPLLCKVSNVDSYGGFVSVVRWLFKTDRGYHPGYVWMWHNHGVVPPGGRPCSGKNWAAFPSLDLYATRITGDIEISFR
jgi:hypothetical protein